MRLLQVNTTITDLSLASNGVGADGCKFIAQAVGLCRALRKVDISCCG